jgi:hypothetical protein
MPVPPAPGWPGPARRSPDPAHDGQVGAQRVLLEARHRAPGVVFRWVVERGVAARAGKIEDDGYEDRTLAYQQMLQLVLGAQREALLRMRSNGELSNEMMNRILRGLDLEESRLEI